MALSFKDRETDRLARRVATLPVLDPRSAEEIIGYGENGLPT